jgi:phage terminase large subunit-like protein
MNPSSSEFGFYRQFAHWPKRKQLTFIDTLTDEEAIRLRYTWQAWARDKQLEEIECPWPWTLWLILAGRGFGKTRTGAEKVIEWAQDDPHAHIALVARTAADIRDVMVEGESGVLACSPPWFKPKYEPSKRRLTWPNGAWATTYSADEPDSLRGPQHTKAWGDEPAAWQYEETHDQLMFGLRLGKQPQAVYTTTPRATRFIKTLVRLKTTHTTRGTTYENLRNLAPNFQAQVIGKYEGTRLGRQELEGLILDDNERALWKREAMIEALRVTEHPDLKRIVVGIDPSVNDGTEVDNQELAECGIIVAGLGVNDHGYLLADKSLMGSPMQWANEGVTAYRVFKADRIVAEVNNGGKLVEAVIRVVDKNVSYKDVHASRGKLTRAEPVSSLAEQGRIHHVGTHPEVEDQMCNWEPGAKSPDRLDALVWAFTELMVDPKPESGIIIAREDEPLLPPQQTWEEAAGAIDWY